jgi:hypothetical protein
LFGHGPEGGAGILSFEGEGKPDREDHRNDRHDQVANTVGIGLGIGGCGCGGHNLSRIWRSALV